MFEDSTDALRESLSALRTSLTKVQRYVESIDLPVVGQVGRRGARRGGRRRAAAAAAAGETEAPARGRARRGRRRRFATAEFILAELGKGSPLRPAELAGRLAEATGRDRKSASANIHTTLSRLRQTGKITTADGVYGLSAGSTAPATPAKRKRRSARRKRAAA